MKLEGESLEVGLGERSYEIVVGRGLGEVLRLAIEDLRAADHPVAAVVDEGFASSHPSFVQGVFGDLPIMELVSGETTKSIATLERIWDFLADSGMDRTGRVVVAGGGVTGDAGGFAAASYLRGIDYLQIPTTLLAMVDSSVGGKTGINLGAGKNLVGAFHQPTGVWADLDLLSTLPPGEFSAGMAEVVKYGLLGDLALFEELEKGAGLNPSSPDLARIVRICCETKARIVSEDERETAGTGGRALLNLGHTFAHAIENVAGYGDYLHGEAVALGLTAATRLSELSGFLPKGSVDRVAQTLKRYDLPVVLRTPLPMEALLEAMYKDKKVRSGRLRFVLMEEVGRAITVDEVSMAAVVDSLNVIAANPVADEVSN
jgi:3-dehydroquinate synthase